MKGRYLLRDNLRCLLVFALYTTYISGTEPVPGSTPPPLPVPTPMPSPSPVPSPGAFPQSQPAPAPIPMAPGTMPIPTPPGQPIDTTTQLPEQLGVQGNWVKKKKWLIAAQEVSNETQNLLMQLESLRKTFNQSYDTIDKQLDDFYQSNGIEQGGIKELFVSIQRYLEKKRKEKIDNDTTRAVKTRKNMLIKESVDELEGEMGSLQPELEQLKLNMQSIEELDKSLTERLKKLDEQIRIAYEEAEKSKDTMQQLWDVLDDKKARSIYYELKGGTLEKIKLIHNYVSNELQQDFNNVLNTINTQIAASQGGIQNLENKGLVIQDRAQRVKEIKKTKELERLEKEREAQHRHRLELEEQALKHEQQGQGSLVSQFISYLYDSFLDTISSAYTTVESLFSSPQSQVKRRKKAQPLPEAGQEQSEKTVTTTEVVAETMPELADEEI
ncbi:MAG: hypothetical protein H6679_05415 [Epsilonproteobacteria bacterium]|nr:hypothetical protein [Campylobacterota bacterium]